ncbi:hypothetical protein FWD07_00565 [Candidatus Saccharibacteria bacterium]|nr:hypothetical protein [Candidatus Saccharibacteria bacterium]
MSDRILRVLEQKPRIISEQGSITLAACLVIRNDGNDTKFGIGLVDLNGQVHQFCGLSSPFQLVKAWRGMRMLDQITEINYRVMYDCYSVNTLDSRGKSYRRNLKNLSFQIDAEKVREKLLGDKMPDAELDLILKICNDPSSEIIVDADDLEKEVKHGTINETSEVKLAFELRDIAAARMTEHERISRIPLPLNESFYHFCLRYGIKHIYRPPGIEYNWGSYGEFNSGLDSKITYSSLEKGSSYAYRICCAQYYNKSIRTSCGTGYVGYPVVRLNSGDIRALISVRYYEGSLCVTVADPLDRSVTDEFTVLHLGLLSPLMIGIMETAPSGDTDNPLCGFRRIRRFSNLFAVRFLKKFFSFFVLDNRPS